MTKPMLNLELQWVDAAGLDDAKAAKWEEIKAAREAAFNAPLVTQYGVFDSDAAARSNIANAVLLAQTLAGMGLPSDIDFTIADNSVVRLRVEEMVTVGLLLGQKVQTAFGRARQLRLLIEAATTRAEVEAVQW